MSMSYTFSPITSKQEFEAAITYVIAETARLSKELFGKSMPLKTVKIFAHYPEEYAFLKHILSEFGEPADIGRSTSTYVSCDRTIAGSHIKNIGIRVPDPYRLQTGCGDFDTLASDEIIGLATRDLQSYIRFFPDMPDTYIELWHPDFDVAGYIQLKNKE